MKPILVSPIIPYERRSTSTTDSSTGSKLNFGISSIADSISSTELTSDSAMWWTTAKTQQNTSPIRDSQQVFGPNCFTAFISSADVLSTVPTNRFRVMQTPKPERLINGLSVTEKRGRSSRDLKGPSYAKKKRKLKQKNKDRLLSESGITKKQEYGVNSSLRKKFVEVASRHSQNAVNKRRPRKCR
jgi:hypothetical protein